MTLRQPTTGWPVNLVLRGRAGLVVGAGPIAARKIASLLELGADVTVVAPDADERIRDWARTGLLRWEPRPFVDSDVEGMWFVVTATDDPGVNRAAFDAAEARRIWCNSADDPSNCSFTLLSVVRRADLVVAFGTGGRSPALATHLRRRFGQEIGPEYEVLLELLSDARETLRASGRSSEDADWQRAFESGIVELVRTGRVDEAKELLQSCL